MTANGVSLGVSVTPQLQILRADGPGGARNDKGRWIFQAQDGMQPKQAYTYTIEAQGMQAGDARFRADLTTATLQTPVLKEEPTRVYDPDNGQPKPAQPGQPGPPRRCRYHHASAGPVRAPLRSTFAARVIKLLGLHVC